MTAKELLKEAAIALQPHDKALAFKIEVFLSTPPREATTRFVKPQPCEVTAYAKSIDYKMDGNQFVDFYESRGWLIGKTKMRDWKAAVRTWKRNEKSTKQPQQKANYGW
jgi:hypothetical protein